MKKVEYVFTMKFVVDEDAIDDIGTIEELKTEFSKEFAQAGDDGIIAAEFDATRREL